MKMSPIKRNPDSVKTRVLGIAPYEGMKTIMEKIASGMPEIELDVFIGDLQRGAEIARTCSGKDYDVIISRGGTAELIEKETSIPVVEVGLSVYDILRAIKLAENYYDRYAIVGFPGITVNAHLLCDLLQYRIDIFTIHDTDEVQQVLQDLREKGYRMVLCDMISQTLAKRLGMNAILITSGAESLTSAFEEAVKLSRSYAHVKAENRFFRELLSNDYKKLLVLDESGDIVFSALDEEIVDPACQLLRQKLDPVLSGNMEKFICDIKGVRYSVACRTMDHPGGLCCAFYFSSGSASGEDWHRGICYSNRKEAEDIFFESLYSIITAANNSQGIVDNVNQTEAPVLLVGEPGSGKEPAARFIYSRSRSNTHPLITINCSLLDEQSRAYLLENEDSPLRDRDNTIYFKDITSLDVPYQNQLLSVILDSGANRLNRMIFSCISEPTGRIPAEAMKFIHELSCVTMPLKPLREQVHEIPALVSMYLNMINVNSTNQIIGLEPEALELLQRYRWPNNLTQFKRILRELSLISTSPYIQAKDVEELLRKEQDAFDMSPDPSSETGFPKAEELDLSGTLSEITGEVVRRVLEACGGNHSAAAKQLGIGRSTLWRYLNK